MGARDLRRAGALHGRPLLHELPVGRRLRPRPPAPTAPTTSGSSSSSGATTRTTSSGSTTTSTPRPDRQRHRIRAGQPGARLGARPAQEPDPHVRARDARVRGRRASGGRTARRAVRPVLRVPSRRGQGRAGRLARGLFEGQPVLQADRASLRLGAADQRGRALATAAATRPAAVHPQADRDVRGAHGRGGRCRRRALGSRRAKRRERGRQRRDGPAGAASRRAGDLRRRRGQGRRRARLGVPGAQPAHVPARDVAAGAAGVLADPGQPQGGARPASALRGGRRADRAPAAGRSRWRRSPLAAAARPRSGHRRRRWTSSRCATRR